MFMRDGMQKFNSRKMSSVGMVGLGLLGMAGVVHAQVTQQGQAVLMDLGDPSVERIVEQCAHKAIDKDLTAKMTIVNRHANGAEKKNVYQRLVKNAQGEDDVVEKMLLLAEYPPEAVGTAFLRWEYTVKTGKYPDQWLYSPSLRKVRKISVRDEQERFLGSTLSLGDIGIRDVARDQHQLKAVEKKGDVVWFVVESVPKDASEAYSKRESTYILDGGWERCRVEKIDYYDRKGLKQKTQTNQWQQVGPSWVWQSVEVDNHVTQERSTFQLEEVKVNTGLKDEIFSERELRRAK